MNVILDLDGTLIDAQTPAGARAALAGGGPHPKHVCGEDLAMMRVYKRPGLDEFLRFCFQNFQGVGLWSHSKQAWVEEALSRVVEPHGWSFVYTEERGTHMSGRQGGCGVGVGSAENTGVKDLRKVFQRKDLRALGFRKDNTIIVEDTADNCRRNYGNAVYVSTYDDVRKPYDRDLPLLQTYLERVILMCGDVRTVEKRAWRAEAAELQKSKEVKKRRRGDGYHVWALENWKKCANMAIDASAHMHSIVTQ